MLLLCLVGLTVADTIRLKDGSIIKGRIVGFHDGQFVVQVGDGARQRQMSFYADEVEAVEFDSTSSAANASRNSNASNTNSSGRAGGNTNALLPNNSGNVTTITVGNTNKNSSNVSSGGLTNANSGSGSITSASTNSNSGNSNTLTNSNNSNSTVGNANTKSNSAGNTGSVRPQAITLNVKVLADNTANGWTSAQGLVVRKGQKIHISAKGQVNLGKGNFAKPEGIKSVTDNDRLMKNEPTGGLIAVVGDDNNEFIFVGPSRDFVATRDGTLFLGINESVLDDNSGAFDVTIEIEPPNN
jgi:PA-IL-like protein